MGKMDSFKREKSSPNKKQVVDEKKQGCDKPEGNETVNSILQIVDGIVPNMKTIADTYKTVIEARKQRISIKDESYQKRCEAEKVILEENDKHIINMADKVIAYKQLLKESAEREKIISFTQTFVESLREEHTRWMSLLTDENGLNNKAASELGRLDGQITDLIKAFVLQPNYYQNKKK